MNSSDKIKVLFGQRVRELRLQQGMSQEAFADKCGLDRTYISGIERGVRNPTLEVIAVIAEGLSTDVGRILYTQKIDEVSS